MTLATSTKLAAHPLFTGSDKDRWKVAKCEFESIVYSRTGSRLEIKGKVQSDPPPLAIIAYADHAEVNIRDYDATSWVGAVGDHGSFHVTVEKHLAGPHELRLAVLLANGATVVPVSIQYDVNKKGVPDVARLNSSQTIGPLEKLLATGRKAEAASAARESLKEFDSSDAEATKELLAQLEHIIALSEPDEVQVLSAVEGNSVFLSDVEWESAEVGYGEPARNRVSLTRKEIAKDKTGILLQVGGRFHAKGIYGHANSSFVFNLDGKWSQFEATVGLQAGAKGLDEFIVKGDGRELYRSKEIAGSVAREFKISVKGVKRLELISKSTITSKGGGWTVWASPLLTR